MHDFTENKIAERYFQKGFNYQMKGELSEAKENYKSSLEVFPTPQAYINLGWTLSKEKKYLEAIQLCTKALDLDLTNGMAYSDIGFYLMKLDRVDEAIAWLNEAVELENFDGKFYAFYNLGRAYERMGNWSKALSMYDKAIELKPGFNLAKKKLLSLSSKLN